MATGSFAPFVFIIAQDVIGTLKIQGTWLQALETKSPNLLMAPGSPNPISFIVKLCSFSPFGNASLQDNQMDGSSKAWLLWIANAFHNKKEVSL